MTEPQENNTSEKEVEQEERTEQIVNEKAEQVEKPEEDPVEKNWKAVREKRKQEEQYRKEQERKIAEQETIIKAMETYMQQQGQQNTQTTQKVDEGQMHFHDDEWITGKQLNQILQKDREERERKDREYQQQRQQMELQSKLNDRYPDYKEVLSQDNLAYLEYHEPEMAAAISQIKDPYLQAAAAYKQVKAFVPQMTDLDRKKMQNTQNAPASLSDPKLNNYGSNPSPNASRSNRLSEQRKQELWQEMLNASR